MDTLQGHLKITHGEEASSLCKLCGNLFKDNEDLKKHFETQHDIFGGGEKRPNSLSDESEESDGDSFTDNTNSQVIYKEHEWGNEEMISEPPIGKNFKSKNEMFAVAAIKLKKLYRKNSIKTIGENTIHVSDVERKGTATEATVELEDETGKGKVLLTFWGPNKKN